MIHSNFFMAFFLGLFSVLPLIGSKNTEPSRGARGIEIVKTGCIGGLGGMGIFGATFILKNGSLSKNEIQPMLLAGAICGGVGIFVGFLNDYQNKNRIYNVDLKTKQQPSSKCSTQAEKQIPEWINAVQKSIICKYESTFNELEN